MRFNAFERFVHWMTATCFIVLALSGLNITFGKPLLLPLIGPDAFTAWSQWAQIRPQLPQLPVHLGVVLILLMWIAGNIPNRVDVEWVKRGGGIVGNDHPPAYRFNAGQKLIYWIVVLGGARGRGHRLSADVPVLRHRHRRACSSRRSSTASWRCCSSPPCSAHIYIGTIGMEGAFEAMGDGKVDVNWAKQHHASGSRRRRHRAPTGATPRATPAE